MSPSLLWGFLWRVNDMRVSLLNFQFEVFQLWGALSLLETVAPVEEVRVTYPWDTSFWLGISGAPLLAEDQRVVVLVHLSDIVLEEALGIWVAWTWTSFLLQRGRARRLERRRIH